MPTTKLKKTSVTEETLAEASRLTSIWEKSKHGLSQSEFGAAYNIGGQTAVSQFLGGTRALSLMAAQGFAQGLGCSISDFSERLAQEATSLVAVAAIAWKNDNQKPTPSANRWPFKQLDPARFDALEDHQKIEIQGVVRMMIGMFEAAKGEKSTPSTEVE